MATAQGAKHQVQVLELYINMHRPQIKPSMERTKEVIMQRSSGFDSSPAMRRNLALASYAVISHALPWSPHAIGQARALTSEINNVSPLQSKRKKQYTISKFE